MKKQFLCILLAICLMVGLFPTTVKATNTESTGTWGDNISWSFDVATDTLTISGEGNIAESTSENPYPWVSLGSEIKNIIIEDGITSLPNRIFGTSYPNVESIQLPTSLQTIDQFAFYSCTSLKEIEIPDGVTSIGKAAFMSCTSLEKAVLADSITEVGSSLFNLCSNLATVNIPKGLTTISNSMFSYCDSLELIVIPDSITSIECYAFAPCEGIKEITIPSSVTSIAGYAFGHMSSLEQITFEGNAPSECKSGVFYDLHTTVYYPTNDETWNSEVMETMSGNSEITWVSYDASELEPTAPEPTEPTPSEPTPIEPEPTEPEPTEPDPTEPTPTEPTTKVEFEDVSSDSWYAEQVDWAVESGITNGTDDTHFSPEDICTRAQIVTFLWRSQGQPEPVSSENPFVDVVPGENSNWYYKAVLWAVEKGITNGRDATHFDPDGECLRSEVVTFLWRTANQPAVSSDDPFLDVSEDHWFYQPVLWAIREGITNGVDDTHFGPDEECTRAQIVTFLYRSKN